MSLSPPAWPSAAGEAPPSLPVELSSEQRAGCLALAYRALQLTLEAKKHLTVEQRESLAAAVGRLLDTGPACGAFPLAVAIWLRNKQELGNRLVSSALLAACAKDARTRPFVRRASRSRTAFG